jgi:hypothetical protein
MTASTRVIVNKKIQELRRDLADLPWRLLKRWYRLNLADRYFI